VEHTAIPVSCPAPGVRRRPGACRGDGTTRSRTSHFWLYAGFKTFRHGLGSHTHSDAAGLLAMPSRFESTRGREERTTVATDV